MIPRIHDTGEGPPLVLLHAFPLDASMWDQQVAELSAGYRCLRPDAPGCGDSPPPEPDASLDGIAGDVLDGLDRLGVARFCAVGLSMGGYLAMAMLRVAPERISALVLADTKAGADSDAARADRLAMAALVREQGTEPIVEPMVERLLAPRSRTEFHVSDPVRGRIRRCTPAGVAACQEAMAARPDSGAILAALSIPVLGIVGAEDAVTPPEVMREMCDAIPGARLQVIPRAGHLSNLEQREVFTAELRGFLNGAYPASTASAGTALGAMQNPS